MVTATDGAALRPTPTPSSARFPAPDIARGTALLGIALANSVTLITGHGQLGPSYRPVDAAPADRAVDVVVGLLVDNRAFPMFTLLVAYGFVVTAHRQTDRGLPWTQTRSLLLRRTVWLGAFGLVHLLVLFSGDILLVYGVLGLALVWLVRASHRTLVVVGVLALVPYLAFHGTDGMPGASTGPVVSLPLEPGTYLAGMVERSVTALTYVVGAPVVVLVFAAPAVVGVLLARHRVLEQPGQHLHLLQGLALGGFAVSVGGAVPLVLASVQVLGVSVLEGYLFGVLHVGTGLAGGVAFAAAVGWVVAVREQGAARRGQRWVPAGVWWVAAAVGRRSLTCYLLQSVVMVPLLAPWGLGLGVEAGTAFAAVVAVGTYAVSALVAVAMERAGRAGPAEVALRRLVYGRRTGGA